MTAEILDQGLRWKLWAPVAFGGGCAIYFSLRFEPPLWPLAAAALVVCAVWLISKAMGAHRAMTLPLMLLACLTLGLAAAKVRTVRVDGPIAPALAEPTVVEGWVVDVDSPGRSGARLVLATVRVRGLDAAVTPVRLRATVKGEPPPPDRPFACLRSSTPRRLRPVPGPMTLAETPISKGWAGWRLPCRRPAPRDWRRRRGA